TIRAEIDACERRTSGLNAEAASAPWVPEPHGPIKAGRGQHLAIWTEGHAADGFGVASEGQGLLLHPPLQEVPFPSALVGPALVEEFLGAGPVVRCQLAFSQGDAREVEIGLQGLVDSYEIPVGSVNLKLLTGDPHVADRQVSDRGHQHQREEGGRYHRSLV